MNSSENSNVIVMMSATCLINDGSEGDSQGNNISHWQHQKHALVLHSCMFLHTLHIFCTKKQVRECFIGEYYTGFSFALDRSLTHFEK